MNSYPAEIVNRLRKECRGSVRPHKTKLAGFWIVGLGIEEYYEP